MILGKVGDVFRLVLCGRSLLMIVSVGCASTLGWYLNAGGRAKMSVPTRIWLGEHEPGTRVEFELPLKNQGGEKLTVLKAETSCGCLTTSLNGAPFEPFVLGAGEERKLSLSVLIRGGAGTHIREVVQLLSTDPERPTTTVSVEAKVEGKLLAVPSELRVNSLLVGASIEMSFLLRDIGLKGEKEGILVISDNPAIIEVKTMQKVSNAEVDSTSVGTDLYRVTCMVHPSQSATVLKGTLRVMQHEHVVLDMPYNIIVKSRFCLSPSQIVLPRRSETEKIYSASILISHANALPFTIVAEQIPGRFSKVLLEQAAAPDWTARILVEAPPRRDGLRERLQFVLRAHFDGKDEEVNVPVLLLE